MRLARTILRRLADGRVLAIAAAMLAACGGGGGGGSGSPNPPSTPAVFRASWTLAQQDLTEGLPGQPHIPPAIAADATIRQVARLSVGGDALRVRLSNRFGTTPATFTSIHVARSTGGASIDVASDRAVTFGGSTMVSIPPGAEVTSDSVNLAPMVLADIAVSVYVTSPMPLVTGHKATTVTSISASGNTVSTAAMSGTTSPNLYWLAGIDVAGAEPASVVVAFGDSITDGSQSTPGAHASYPEQLAARFSASRIAVVNAGIGGNRWLQDNPGPAGATRFDRDVLEAQGVTHTIVLLGINDLQAARDFGLPPVTAETLIAAAGQAVSRARARNVKVLLGTLLPYKGARLFNAEDEAQRQAYNAWVRGNRDAAAIVDFDAALRDPGDPQSLAAQYSSPDHLHPNDAGYAAMAALVDVNTLR